MGELVWVPQAQPALTHRWRRGASDGSYFVISQEEPGREDLKPLAHTSLVHGSAQIPASSHVTALICSRSLGKKVLTGEAAQPP